MADSGIEEFAAADDVTLHAGMARAARLGLPVAVHAESQELIARATAAARAAGPAAMRDYLASRPIEAEMRGDRAGDRVGRARPAARCTSSTCRAARGVALVAQARAPKAST